jgi:hypothetical protein
MYYMATIISIPKPHLKKPIKRKYMVFKGYPNESNPTKHFSFFQNDLIWSIRCPDNNGKKKFIYEIMFKTSFQPHQTSSHIVKTPPWFWL